MVDLLQEFNSKSIPSACEFLTNYCDAYINTAALSMQHAQSLHSALPGIITTIFGGPSARGWAQTDIPADHTTAIRRALRFDGAFIKALLHLSNITDFSYDVDTEKLSDVRKALAAGAVQYLPRVYTKCAHFEKRVGTGSSDIRTSATRQSTIFPRSVSGEHRIKFNIIQFFLYYTVLVPCTISSSAASQSRPSSVLTSSTTNISSVNSPFATSRLGANTNARSNQQLQPKQALKSRSIIGSVYEELMKEYIRYFIACEPGATFHPTVGTFFLDACIELWVRTPYVAAGQKLNAEQMHFVTIFVKYIVSCDLRRCHKDDQEHYRMVYESIKSELYGFISRLALNWSKDDDYLQVISLWAIWAAPWRLGANPRTKAEDTHRPIAEGWSYHLMDISLCYFSLAEIFLQRMATFTYPDKPPQAAPPPFPHFHTQPPAPLKPISGGQFRITRRFISVFKTEGVVEFLGDIERGLIRVQADAAPNGSAGNNQAVAVLATKYFDDQNNQVRNSLKLTYDDLVQLGGGTWRPPNLYIKESGPRASSLIRSLDALDQAASPEDNNTPRPWGATATVGGTRSSQYIKDVEDTAKAFAATFSLPMPGRKKPASTSRSIFSTLQKPSTRSVSTARRREATPLAGLQKGGFLTEQERILVRQGRMRCSHENIPILGPRGQEVVKSYELAFMVRWIIPFDRWMNSHYLRWRPSNVGFLPETLTVRPLAALVNLVYLVVFVLICYMVVL
ncbi:hypothetical protein BJV82DRAFT_388016 [Fennellomyces sp. T-0311]|nr:hypothetical protein BJV82DRAFT_388016 [Fennellomyces sp. T-0311]